MLALALFAWFMETATKPETDLTQARTETTLPGAATPPTSGSGGVVTPNGNQPSPVPTSVPQLSGSQVELLTEQLEAALDKLPDGAKTCLVVRELTETSDTLTLGGLYDRNGQLSLVPASNQKLITAAAALMLLGPDYRFTTRVLAAKTPNRNGTLYENLYLVGGGDPVLYTADYLAVFARPPVIYTEVEQLAQQVHDRGLRQLFGSVMAVESRYDSVREASPLLSNYFVGPLSALLVNDGYENYLERLDLGAAPVIAAEPDQFAASLFDDLLENLGVIITERPRKASIEDDIGGYIELARLESAPLSELLASLLADSDNTSAELLLKEIATYSSYLAAQEAGDYAPTTTTPPPTSSTTTSEAPTTTRAPFVLTPPSPRAGDDWAFGSPGAPPWGQVGQTDTTADPAEPQEPVTGTTVPGSEPDGGEESETDTTAPEAEAGSETDTTTTLPDDGEEPTPGTTIPGDGEEPTDGDEPPTEDTSTTTPSNGEEPTDGDEPPTEDTSTTTPGDGDDPGGDGDPADSTSTTSTSSTTTTSLPETEDPKENPLLIEPGSTLAGLRQIAPILLANGIHNWVGTPRDGSGLDRGNLLSCTVIADVLDYFGPNSAFAAALAVAGERGTLTNLFVDTPLEGRLRGKSGSLPGVLALSGFITADPSRSLTFAWLANFDSEQAEAVSEVREGLMLALAAYLELS